MDRNADYPGDNNPVPQDPIPFDENIAYTRCIRIPRIEVVQNVQNILTIRFLRTEEDTEEDDEDEEDDDTDYEDDEDGDMDDSEEEEDDDVLVIKEGGREGYLLRRELKPAQYGRVRFAYALRRREMAADADVGPDTLVRWDKTGKCAVKEMPHDTIQRLRGRRIEDPIKEICAMQYIQQWNEAQQGDGDPHPPTVEQLHVILPRDFLTDGEYLYNIMPYLNGSELLVHVGSGRLDEQRARVWFRKMLDGLRTLQEAHVCHRDISPENFMVHNDDCIVIDMGMCLRIPYNEDVDPPRRCLITPQHRCGKWRYMSPEIYNQQVFDGHAVDLWAVAVILFIMLTGSFPWKEPTDTQQLFTIIVDGRLTSCLDLLAQRNNIPHLGRDPLDYIRRMLQLGQDAIDLLLEMLHLDPGAIDLLQKMLRRDPRDRLSLDQILAHPWLATE